MRVVLSSLAGGVWAASFEADYANFEGEFAISTSSIVEGAARTAPRQAWLSTALSTGGGAMIAVAPGSAWGLLRSADGGQTWAPPVRCDALPCIVGVSCLTSRHQHALLTLSAHAKLALQKPRAGCQPGLRSVSLPRMSYAPVLLLIAEACKWRRISG